MVAEDRSLLDAEGRLSSGHRFESTNNRRPLAQAPAPTIVAKPAARGAGTTAAGHDVTFCGFGNPRTLQ